VGEIGDQAMEGGGIIASMLSTLGLLLPRSLGAPLTRAASQMPARAGLGLPRQAAHEPRQSAQAQGLSAWRGACTARGLRAPGRHHGCPP